MKIIINLEFVVGIDLFWLDEQWKKQHCFPSFESYLSISEFEKVASSSSS